MTENRRKTGTGRLDVDPRPSPAGDDPFQPHALRAALRAVGGDDGLAGRAGKCFSGNRPEWKAHSVCRPRCTPPGRTAHGVCLLPYGNLSLAGPGGTVDLDGRRPQCGDGLQSPGRPAAGRAEPANRQSPSAAGDLERRQRGRVHRVVVAGVRRGDALFPAAEPDPALRRRARAGLPLRLQFRQAVHGAFPFLAGRGDGAGPAGRVGGGPGADRLAAAAVGRGRGPLGPAST